MKVTFVRPNIFDARLASAMEVLSVALLKGLTPPDVETAFHDERLAPVPLDEPTDLVALTVETFTARRAYQIAGAYRRRGVKVVMGGFHPTMMPEEAGRFADAVVVGDAENSWPQVLADARAGRLRPVYRAEAFPPLEGVKADRSVFRGKRYAPLALVQTSRGCRFNCSFCSIRAFYGASLRQRPVREVVEEIEALGRKDILFVDDNLLVDARSARELFEALVALRIRWSCQISIDVAKDAQLLRLMERSGCVSALIGFESLNAANLKAIRKGWNLKWSDYDTAIRRLQDAGIMIYGTFVLGWDEDTPEVFDQTVDFAIRHKFALAGFNPLMPTPGTAMYERLRREGRLIYEKWWLDPRYRYGDAVFHPRRMTAGQFAAGCYRARRAFSAYGSIARRLLDRRTSLRSPYRVFAYALSNHLLRREIYAKQGMALGSLREDDPHAKLLRPPPAVGGGERLGRNGHGAGVLWLTGLSASGKSTLAAALERALFDRGYQVFALDGDAVREGVSADLGFSPAARSENVRRAGELAALFAQAGCLVIAAFISPYRRDRERVRARQAGGFHEVYLSAPLEVCEARDAKGLYRRARTGEVRDFTGISAPYEPPLAPELTIDTAALPVAECLRLLLDYVARHFPLAIPAPGAAAQRLLQAR